MDEGSPLPTTVGRTNFVGGFHGTTAEAVDDILQKGFRIRPSRRSWLGSGAYFFQDAPALAWHWAEWVVDNLPQRGTRPAVIWAVINLENCVDLLDVRWFGPVRAAYDAFVENRRRQGMSVPDQDEWVPGDGREHPLDCAIMNSMFAAAEKKNNVLTTARAVFWEGKPVYDKSHLQKRAHVAISARCNSVIQIKKCFFSKDELLSPEAYHG